MSRYDTTKYRQEALARARFERALQALKLELAAGTAKCHLEPRVELCELLLEQTGGNLYTEEYRRKLGEVKARVAALPEQPRLRLLRSES